MKLISLLKQAGLAVLASTCLLAGTAQAQAPAQPPLTIAYITNGNTNEGWTLINNGAERAGQAAGVRLIKVAAERGELSRQLAIVEDMISRRVNAIAIAPVDSAGIAPAINRAIAAGIPVIAVDTGITGARITSYVATDNVRAAVVQGRWTGEQVRDGDTVIYITGDQSQSTGRERRSGFLQGLNEVRRNVRVVEVPTTWDQTMAQNGVEAALRSHRNARVIASAWDGGALGARAAMLSAGLRAGSIQIVGFDGSPGGLMMMRQGWMQANVAQMLSRIGQVGVDTAVSAARGQTVPERIDTGSFLVLPANLEQFARDSGVIQFMRP